MQRINENIDQQIITCKNHIKSLKELSLEPKNILKWFTQFCDEITKLIKLISTLNKETNEKLYKRIDNVIFYFVQLLTTLQLLIDIFEKENTLNEAITEGRYCVIKQTTCCFEYIQNILTPSNNDEGSIRTYLEAPTGSFLTAVDTALNKVAEIGVNNSKMTEICNETREAFEEVLSYAMSIAQIALIQDFKIIKGSSQTVLEALDSLENQVNKTPPNISMINLFVDTCTNKLCSLERKVNTAVLKLCLKIFADYTTPLDEIYRFSIADPTNNSKLEEFDNLVIDFDLHVDRIMQIGLFAVSCSSQFNRSIKIKSCLASLEAMETELIPTFRATLLEPSTHNVSYSLILKNYWFQQAEELKKLIYLIIDPFAFCQVIFEEIQNEIDELSKSFKQKNYFKLNDINNVLKYSKVLKMFLDAGINEFSYKETEKVNAHIDMFSKVLHEVECAANKLLSMEDNCENNNFRVLKRCKILLGIVKDLWYCFIDEIKEETLNNQIDESNNSLNAENIQAPTGNVFLDHIINRGKQLLQERSILYRTPMPESNRILKTFSKGDHKASLFAKRVNTFRKTTNLQNSENESSLDLQITDILNELSHLSTTFTKK